MACFPSSVNHNTPWSDTHSLCWRKKSPSFVVLYHKQVRTMQRVGMVLMYGCHVTAGAKAAHEGWVLQLFSSLLPFKSVQLPKMRVQLRSPWCLLLLSDASYVVMSLFLISHYLWNLQKVKYLCSIPAVQTRQIQVRQWSQKKLMVLSLEACSYTEHSCKLVFLQEAKLRLKNPKWFRLFTLDFFFFFFF